ncbi:hypothetical protein DSM3645_26179 [Blastopirellula marina DSM 3645]|uniref:Uncharacterized protein n=1 Tax=Blastopirellula marina DSM 3645 TaxID=314230 RepID=A3ZWE9_9BACT|nr:hypothetical protein DSM3645_26179 [Blastopirellula marina DSM 3645]
MGAGIIAVGPDLLSGGIGAIGGYWADGSSTGALHGAFLGMMIGSAAGGLARGAWGTRRGLAADGASPARVVAASTDGASNSLLPVSSLNRRQLRVHNSLTESGATGRFLKRKISMTDLRAIGRVTGDEYSVYTLGGRRFVIRGYGNEIRVTESMAADLAAGQYGRWSGHTHPPGYGIGASTFDRWSISVGQERSALWGDGGYIIFHQTPADDYTFESARRTELMRRWYERQQ